MKLRLLPLLFIAQAGLAQHWADRPIVRPSTAAGTHPIDALATAAREAAAVGSTGPADDATWLRRVALDLTGIPPTPEEYAAFVSDRSDAARARAVDALLASPRFAERWAQWWL
ncbi:MAG: hypothetical protein RL398_1786, partial [Planctomycetota bacterium]